MRSGRYQLLSTMPTLPFSRQSKRHLSPVPRILVLSGIVIPFVVISFVLYKLAIITNAFRTYEAHPPTFSEPFRGKGEDVEPRVEAFPRWTTADTTDVDVTIWNVKKELSGRYSAAGLEESRVSCPAITSLRADQPTLLQARYAHLFPSSTPSPYVAEPQGFFFALNLYNSRAVIPHLTATLLTLAGLLGPSNVHVAIFENGSNDGTPELLAHFARALTAAGVAHSIKSDSHQTDWWTVNRIEQLAVYRNVAIESVFDYSPANAPLFESSRLTAEERRRHPTLPTDLIFVNDIFLCPTDVLELLHQRRFQDASATCGLDWRDAPSGSLWSWMKGYLSPNYRFYDNWVTRSMEGFPLRPRVDMFGELRDGVRELFHWDSDPTYLIRWRAALPLPVYSCWNGVIALSAKPFLPPAEGGHAIKFRAGDEAHGECAASECKLVARDWWSIGEKRWVLVPRVAVTYDEEGYRSDYIERRVRRGGVAGMLADLEQKKFRHAPSTAMPLEEKIDWSMVKDPEQVVCFPYHKGDRLEVWPFYREGTTVSSTSRHDFNRTAHIPWEDIIPGA